MSKLNKCPFCDGEVDWCKNDLDVHDPRGDCHYITCKTCGEFNLNFPDDLDWPEIYKHITDKWNSRTSTPNAKIDNLLDKLLDDDDYKSSQFVLDLFDLMDGK